ncbi:low-temperature-induced 65 kDa protein-like isoform X2 [Magnolia sinica]|uniref:low-temperature-induced 65 kDa protein-like isoform X2 n=1 Tax=Magnolia sinica TaxID=86752 RepID=UPI002659FEAF|nr:low-temperature-induced 65 kDa protein-like isoform X2 [Magnolia sinica]
MATQITPAHPHNYEDDPNRGVIHSVVEEEDHHEKKSVLKKVKDKAKKIKHTLAKKTHVSDSDHDDDRNPAYEVHTTVIREDDDDEDSEDEPEVHGAPMYQSATAHDRTGQEEITDESSVNLGKVRPPKGDKEHVPKDPTTFEAGPHAPTDYPTRPSEGPQHIPMDGPPFEVDPHAPKERPTSPANHQTKVVDPTASGGNEAGFPHLDRSFQAMNLSDKANPPTGSPDQFSPESTSEKAPIIQENLHPVPDTNNESQPSKDQPHASSYTQKISSATSALAQRAVSAKNAVASKLGYGQSGSATSTPSSGGTEYGRRIVEKLAPVYGKVADAGCAVVSKIQGSGNRSESPESEVKVTETESGVKRSDTGVSVSEFVAEKLRPGDEHKALSEMICDAIQKKREEPESGSVQPPVAERVSVSGGDGSGKGVVERFRGAVGSVFGMGGRSRDTPAPDSQSRDGDEGEDRKNQVSMT